MATVRIYKVAELLNLTSQEVMTLLKKEHGIEVKSASSTIEEVVAGLRAAGYDSVDKLLEADPAQLALLPGFDAETVEAVLSAARIQQASGSSEPAVDVEEGGTAAEAAEADSTDDLKG